MVDAGQLVMIPWAYDNGRGGATIKNEVQIFKRVR